MKIVDIIFGNRLYINDPELGKFFTEKKLNHSEPLIWKSFRPILQNSYPTELNLEGSYTEIFPIIKEALFDFLENEKEIEKKVIEKNSAQNHTSNISKPLQIKKIVGQKNSAMANLIVDFEYINSEIWKISIVGNEVEFIPNIKKS